MANDTTKTTNVKDATEKALDKQTSGQVDPKLPGLGRLPNKQFLSFGRRAKSQKRASVNTLALLAV